MATTSKDQRIKEMLGFGISQEAVANAVGVTPGYISQLMSDESFEAAVADLKITHTVAATQRDLSYDALEDKLLVTMHDMVDQGRFQKPEQVLHALRVSNGMVRRGSGVQQASKPLSVVVNLSLPGIVRDRFIPDASKERFVTNRKGEVIEVNGQTTVTMDSKQLVKQIIDSKKEGGQDEGDFTKLGNQIQRVG
jgi:hypothetical protein